MVGFEDSCPKTQAWNLAPAGAILVQIQRFQNFVHDPQFFEPWQQEFSEKEWKWSLKSKNSCPSFGTEFPKTGHSVLVKDFSVLFLMFVNIFKNTLEYIGMY